MSECSPCGALGSGGTCTGRPGMTVGRPVSGGGAQSTSGIGHELLAGVVQLEAEDEVIQQATRRGGFGDLDRRN